MRARVYIKEIRDKYQAWYIHLFTHLFGTGLSWNDGHGRPWPQIGPHRQALQPRSATMADTNQRTMTSHPQEMNSPPEQNVDSAKITHIRTRSSPSKLIGDLDLQMTANGLLKKRSDCNFADINQEELTVHQDLLVSRNPRLEDAKSNSQDNGMKSSSFRRRGVRNILSFSINLDNECQLAGLVLKITFIKSPDALNFLRILITQYSASTSIRTG